MSVVRACTSVAHVTLITNDDKSGEKRLAGYIVPQHGAAIDRAQLRTEISKTLPDT